MQTVVGAVAPSTTSLPRFDRPTYLMCPPQWYDVDYVINPWMAGNLHRPSRDRAFTQWRQLFDELRRYADLRVLPAERGFPDMTFVGHTALVQHGIAAISSFAFAQRQGEEGHLRRWMEEAGFLLWDTPREITFEGGGDATFDEAGQVLWAAHGVRTCERSHKHLASAWHVPVHSLHLVDPRFYHLDTCFAQLHGGFVMYYPDAFDGTSQARIEAAFPAERRVVVSETEAIQFACNVIPLGRDIFMGEVKGTIAERLSEKGFRVHTCPMSEFRCGGGSVGSLALRLSDSSVPA